MTETIETVNDEIVEEVFDEVAETATKSSNKFLCGIGVGIGLGIAIVEGCKHIVIPGINRLKERIEWKIISPIHTSLNQKKRK